MQAIAEPKASELSPTLPPTLSPALEPSSAASPSIPESHGNGLLGASALLAAASLAACGGAGEAGDAEAAANSSKASNAVRLQAGGATAAITDSDAQVSRFLSQAAFGATSQADIQAVRNAGSYEQWVEDQAALPANIAGHVAWMDGQNYRTTPAFYNEVWGGIKGFPNTNWRALVTDQRVLRQRMALALSEILVVAKDGIMNMRYRGYALAYYQDLLESHAFGNYFELLKRVAKAPAMGTYLSHRNNRMQTSTSFPDENFARELMQLFSLGLTKLDAANNPVPTYEQRDVTELARVFTGWVLNPAAPAINGVAAGSDAMCDMVQTSVAGWHDTGEKKLFKVAGTINTYELTIPGTNAETELNVFVEWLSRQACVGPFIARQLIQRFVTANPSAAYVQRVATAFNPPGVAYAQRGDLKAAIKAILTDPEARTPPASSAAGAANWGKLREPIVRLIQWARTCGHPTDTSLLWDWGDTGSPIDRLGQSPLNAPSVFNFFRPGYVPPGTGMAAAVPSATSPEFQITHEASVAAWINLMQQVVKNGFSSAGPSPTGYPASYAGLIPASNSAAAISSLVDTLNLRLAAGSLSPATLTLIKDGLTNQRYASTELLLLTQVAVLMVLCAPEYIVLK